MLLLIFHYVRYDNFCLIISGVAVSHFSHDCHIAPNIVFSIASRGARKGKGMHEAIGTIVMHPKWLHPNKAS